ncbi:hypothetical protein H4219_005733 [Mycoemilia scoparia]|uniref:Uncharacterized protein n=1 Tax=Mycoemilia scoparia TaxID=417184 RepID=A0A9W7ZSE6_9FUNG|nr:hypothetical protein H4219_005733 [Mycoemilia scoparia]
MAGVYPTQYGNQQYQENSYGSSSGFGYQPQSQHQQPYPNQQGGYPPQLGHANTFAQQQQPQHQSQPIHIYASTLDQKPPLQQQNPGYSRPPPNPPPGYVTVPASSGGGGGSGSQHQNAYTNTQSAQTIQPSNNPQQQQQQQQQQQHPPGYPPPQGQYQNFSHGPQGAPHHQPGSFSDASSIMSGTFMGGSATNSQISGYTGAGSYNNNQAGYNNTHPQHPQGQQQQQPPPLTQPPSMYNNNYSNGGGQHSSAGSYNPPIQRPQPPPHHHHHHPGPPQRLSHHQSYPTQIPPSINQTLPSYPANPNTQIPHHRPPHQLTLPAGPPPPPSSNNAHYWVQYFPLVNKNKHFMAKIFSKMRNFSCGDTIFWYLVSDQIRQLCQKQELSIFKTMVATALFTRKRKRQKKQIKKEQESWQKILKSQAKSYQKELERYYKKQRKLHGQRGVGGMILSRDFNDELGHHDCGGEGGVIDQNYNFECTCTKNTIFEGLQAYHRSLKDPTCDFGNGGDDGLMNQSLLENDASLFISLYSLADFPSYEESNYTSNLSGFNPPPVYSHNNSNRDTNTRGGDSSSSNINEGGVSYRRIDDPNIKICRVNFNNNNEYPKMGTNKRGYNKPSNYERNLIRTNYLPEGHIHLNRNTGMDYDLGPPIFGPTTQSRHNHPHHNNDPDPYNNHLHQLLILNRYNVPKQVNLTLINDYISKCILYSVIKKLQSSSSKPVVLSYHDTRTNQWQSIKWKDFTKAIIDEWHKFCENPKKYKLIAMSKEKGPDGLYLTRIRAKNYYDMIANCIMHQNPYHHYSGGGGGGSHIKNSSHNNKHNKSSSTGGSNNRRDKFDDTASNWSTAVNVPESVFGGSNSNNHHHHHHRHRSINNNNNNSFSHQQDENCEYYDNAVGTRGITEKFNSLHVTTTTSNPSYNYHNNNNTTTTKNHHAMVDKNKKEYKELYDYISKNHIPEEETILLMTLGLLARFMKLVKPELQDQFYFNHIQPQQQQHMVHPAYYNSI